ncbi:MAG: F0F1 ATP synthase subunit delta [Actinomycetia bacterium]|nr:F0F1 ATP synthase subunit delta [Actinomycetes bacterium]
MQGASRESLSSATERLDTVLASAITEAGDVAERATHWVGRFMPSVAQRVETVLPVVGPLGIGDALFSVAALLDAQPSLRGALTDPARSGADKASLAQELLGGKVPEQVVDLVSEMVRSRWSKPRDLAEAATRMGVEAVLVSAQRHDRLADVQDELFRFARIVAAQPELRLALTDRALPVDRKSDLLTELLKEKTTVETARLIVHAVTEPRGRSLEVNLESLATAAAARRQRQLATVTSAVPLTEQQRARLAAALSTQLGFDVLINVVIDSEVVGGLRVSLGGELIDGTLSSRLSDAQRRIAG